MTFLDLIRKKIDFKGPVIAKKKKEPIPVPGPIKPKLEPMVQAEPQVTEEEKVSE